MNSFSVLLQTYLRTSQIVKFLATTVIATTTVALIGCLTLVDFSVSDTPVILAASRTDRGYVTALFPIKSVTDDAPIPDSAAVSRIVAGSLAASPTISGQWSLSVADALSGQNLFTRNAHASTTPASVTKIVTASAAFSALDGNKRLETSVYSTGNPGELVLVGGGDPTLAATSTSSGYPQTATLAELAKKVRTHITTPITRIIVDSGIFVGLLSAPGWDADVFTDGFVAPISGLIVDGARISPSGKARYQAGADIAAGKRFAALLGVSKAVVQSGHPARSDDAWGTVSSPTVSELIQIMLQRSDNTIAEMLGRHCAIATGLDPTFAGATQAVTNIAAQLGIGSVEIRLFDTSGLSRQNTISVNYLTTLLTAAAHNANSRLRPLFASLPVGGYSGTLQRRFSLAGGKAGKGIVHAKTGSLLGVSALAGVAVDVDGRQLVFSIIVNGLPANGNFTAEIVIDRVAAALSSCGCRATG